MAEGVPARRGDALLLVGTRKGAFILHSAPPRQDWRLYGPYSPGSDVFHLTYDARGGGRLFAATNSMWFGPQVEFSQDLGGSWEQAQAQPRFAGNADNDENAGPTVHRLWHIEPGRDTEPGTLYAGVAPAALFQSADDGVTWQEVTALSRHPTRDGWMPGLGGLCLHSIQTPAGQPNTMWVGISAVGVFRTDDAGESWQPANKGVRADFDPGNRYPEWGVCTHKLLSHPRRQNLLYQQNHCGVYRSDNGGREWQDITGDLPSRFGFVLGLDCHDPDTLFVVPEDTATLDDVGGGLRYVSHAKLRVFRSRDGGQSWTALTQGLPQENAYLHTLREGMATDTLEPAGVYLGTTSGQIFYSRDGGDRWELMIEYLPPINSLEAAIVAA